MKKKVLCILFRGKIEMELLRFKKDMKNQEPEEIIACAYEIDMKISICELLLEMSGKFPEDVLAVLIPFPELLDYVYCMWLEKEDSRMEELRDCINEHLLGCGETEKNTLTCMQNTANGLSAGDC